MQPNHADLGMTDGPATFAMFETDLGLRPVANVPASDRMAFLPAGTDAPTPPFRVEDATDPDIIRVDYIQGDVA